MSTMYTLAVTVASNKGTVILQDHHPAEGPFVMTCLTGAVTTTVITDNQFGRIQTDLAALVAAGACTYAITMTPADPLFTALSTAITPGGSLTSPLQYKGSIAVNTSFPLIASVAAGWMYHITADVTDNAGGTYTNKGTAFLAGDEIVWDGSDWIKTGSTLTNPFQFKGSLTAANTFPPPAATATTGVRDGWTYRVTTACTDDGGAAYTNTRQAFVVGDIITWRTNAWYKIGSLVYDAATAYEFGDYQIRTGAGAADLLTAVTQVVTAGVGTAITLAAGAVVGQNKIVRLASVTTPLDTAVLTITSGPGGPYTLRKAGDFIHVKWNGATWGLVNQCPAVNTLVDRGAITINTDFPPPTGNLLGDCYRVLADVIDNGGASCTNTGGVFTEGDHIMWDGVSAWVVLGKKYAMIEKGAISLATHFPLRAFVKRGYVYCVTANVTDSAGTTYTNTSQTFLAGDCIEWNGTNWTIIGTSGRLFAQINTQAIAATATVTQFIAPAAGRIIGVYFKSDVTAETTESMTVDVHIGAQTTLTGDISIAAAQTTVPVAGVIDTGSSHNVFAAGQVITIIRTYTAGSGTPAMVATHVSIFAELT